MMCCFLFRCVYPNRRRTSSIPVGLQSASLIKEKDAPCPTGFLFSPEVGTCLEIIKPKYKYTAKLESDNLVMENSVNEITSFDKFQAKSDCLPSEEYLSEISRCVPKSSLKASNPLPALSLIKEDEPATLEIKSFQGSIHTATDCKDFEIFVPDINDCVDPFDVKPLESASLIRDSKPDWDKDPTCKEGELFVHELGLCMPAHPPKEKQPLVSDSLVKEKEPAAPVATVEKDECPPGQFMNPSIGVCMSLGGPVREVTTPSSANLVKDYVEPAELEIKAFETSKSSSQCPKGTFFVLDLGICLPGK